VLALPLSADAQFGALNLYAIYPVAFGVVDRARAAILVSMASLALSVAYSMKTRCAALRISTRRWRVERPSARPSDPMERERITAAQAFDILRRASQHLNVKLRQVAEDLIETGVEPDTAELASHSSRPARSPDGAVVRPRTFTVAGSKW